MEKDPVCGMRVEPQQAVARRVYRATIYYFCSMDCAAKFERAPEHFVGVPVAGDTGSRRAGKED